MTAKRDLKKRIRDRQAKTGETYTTARRHVLAARGEDTDLAANTDAPEVAELRELAETRSPIEVDEIIDVTDAAKAIGLACRVLIYPRLVKVADTTVVLDAIRTALAATKNDPATYLLRAVLAGEAHSLRMTPRERGLRDPEFMAKIAAGLTAVSKDGRMFALHVNGHAGMVTVVCAAWRRDNTLMITTPEDRLGPVLAGLAAAETLFLVYEGRRYKIYRQPFVIGRHPTCDLQIRDGHVSRKHVAIVQRHGAFYIVDLGSHAGIEYKGLKISNKRIEEGDMFKIHEYALRFTFHETDA